MARQSKLSKVGGNKGGHAPTKLTPESEDLILKALRAGGHLDIAAASAGVHHKTLLTWFKRGRDGEEPYKSFLERCSLVMASLEIRVVRDVINAGQQDPNHLKWWLERRFPERWGKKVQQNVSGNVKIEVSPVNVNDEVKTQINEVWELLPPEERGKLLDQYQIGSGE